MVRKINPDLDTKDRIAIERLVRDRGKQLQDQGVLDEQVLPEMEKYRKDLEARVMGKNPKSSSAGSAATPPPPTPGTVIDGYRYTGPPNDAAQAADQKNWVKE